MDTKQLKQALEDYKTVLAAQPNQAFIEGPDGPLSISIMKSIIAAIEALEQRIVELESRTQREPFRPLI